MAIREQILFQIAAHDAASPVFRALNRELRNAGIAVNKVTGATKKGANAFGRMNTSMTNLIGNAVKWALAYQVIYGILRLVTNAIRNAVKAWVDLDDVMAKVQTVTRDTGEGMAKIMNVFRREVY